jgi:hypothetical protein
LFRETYRRRRRARALDIHIKRHRFAIVATAAPRNPSLRILSAWFRRNADSNVGRFQERMIEKLFKRDAIRGVAVKQAAK